MIPDVPVNDPEAASPPHPRSSIIRIDGSSKDNSLDNQPFTLLFYRPVVVQTLPQYAEVAQLAEQRPEKPRVRSSILRLGTILFFAMSLS
jgi:hypothetical protein